MAKSHFLLPLCLTVATAQSAVAQSFAHEGSTVTLSFNFHNDGEDDPYSENYTTHLSAASAYSFGGAFGAVFTLAYENEEYTDSFYSERYLIDVNPTYNFGPGTIGLYYSAIRSNDGDEQTNDETYGLSATFASGPVTAESYIGVYEEDGGFVSDTLGLGGSYAFGGGAAAYVTHQRDTLSNDNYRAFTAIGASYDLSAVTGAPVVVAAEAGRHSFDNLSLSESEWNQFGISASYNFGGGAQSMFQGLRSYDFYYD